MFACLSFGAKRRKRVEPEQRYSMPDVNAGLNNILQAAVNLGQQLEILGISYCVIGGVAVQRWGEPVLFCLNSMGRFCR